MNEVSIINGYKIKDKKAIRYYENINMMKNDSTLKSGMAVCTLGYNSANDNGEAIYQIINNNNIETDNYNHISLNNGLIAELIHSKNRVKILAPYRNGSRGDCYIIQCANKNIIVDFGDGNTQSIINFLVQNHITKIDYAIISHYHVDHVNGDANGNPVGLETIITNSQLDFSDCEFILPFSNNGSIYSNFYQENARYIPTMEQNVKTLLNNLNISYHEVRTDEILTLSNANYIKFLNADLNIFENYYNELEYGYEETGTTIYNNFSLIFECHFGETIFLCTGDIQTKAKEMNAPKISENIDIYKCEHHGWESSEDISWKEKISNVKYAFVLGGSLLPDIYNLESYPNVAYLRAIGSKLFDLFTLQNDVFINIVDNKISYNSKNGSTLQTLNFKYYLEALRSSTKLIDCSNSEKLIENYDLDNAQIGTMNSPNSEITNSLLHKPPINTGFKLITMRLFNNNDDRLYQFALQNWNTCIWVRNKGTTWSEWKLIDVLGSGTPITNLSINNDLNNLTNYGKYYTSSGSESSALSNVPTNVTVAFVIEVNCLHRPDRLIQKMTTNAGEMYYRIYNDNGWGNWQKISTTTV